MTNVSLSKSQAEPIGRPEERHVTVQLTAPRGVELNEHVLVLVLGNLFEVLADQDLDGLGVPVLGDFLREEMLLELSVQEVGDELADAGLVDSAGLCK